MNNLTKFRRANLYLLSHTTEDEHMVVRAMTEKHAREIAQEHDLANGNFYREQFWADNFVTTCKLLEPQGKSLKDMCVIIADKSGVDNE